MPGCDLSTSLVGVDAVCIDQTSLEERNQKVGQVMADIYRDADEVIIWLGPSPLDSDWAMDKVSNMGQESEEPWELSEDYKEALQNVVAPRLLEETLDYLRSPASSRCHNLLRKENAILDTVLGLDDCCESRSLPLF